MAWRKHTLLKACMKALADPRHERGMPDSPLLFPFLG